MSQEDLDSGLEEIAQAFQKNVKVSDQRYRLKTYKDCFVGSDAVDYLVASGTATSRVDAVQIGKALASQHHLFEHVARDHAFEDDHLFYRYLKAGERGQTTVSAETGEPVGWSDFLAPVGGSNGSSLQPKLPQPDLESISKNDEHVVSQVWPLDDLNVQLLDHVHPANWKDPLPNQGDGSFYDLVVIGGGTAGLVTAAGASGVGAKVALIEAHMLGGDCLNVGCVPSKSIIHSAKLAHTLKNAEHLAENGISIDPSSIKVDFEKVMERVRRIRTDISHHDSAERYTKEFGVHVYIGHAVFNSTKSVEVNGRTISFKRCCIATGGYPTLIPMPGLKELHDKAVSKETVRPIVMTNETFFNLTVQPKNLVVVGAGVIGLELAQSMQRLGTPVTVLGRSGKILPKEDEDMAQVVKDQLVKDGVNFMLSVSEYKGIELTGKILENGLPEMKITVAEKGKDGQTKLLCDAFLVAAGRRPNVTGMNLEVAQVEYDVKAGIKVNDNLRTTNPIVYSAGDCCSQFKFTHAADFMARTVIKNSLFFGKEKMSKLLIPYATFTDPEIASVGLYEQDLKDSNTPYRIFEKHFVNNDRAICDGETHGFVRFRIDGKTDTILGCSIVGPGAGNMISEATLAMQSGTGLGSLAAVIHPYPTNAEVLRQSGDLYNKTRLTLTVKKLLRGVIGIQR